VTALVKTGDWSKTRRTFFANATQLNRAIRKAMKQEGQFLRKKLVQGIRKQAPGGRQFKKLAKTTVATRRFRRFRGTKALIRTGGQGLVGSISVLQKRDFVFIGVQRTVRADDGRLLADIMRLNEFGSKPIVIKMTAKMRRFLFAAFEAHRATRGLEGEGGGGIIIVRIPPRPVFGPVFKRFAKPSVLKKRVMNRVAIIMKGNIGRPSGKPPT
jgi:hypothetical protein